MLNAWFGLPVSVPYPHCHQPVRHRIEGCGDVRLRFQAAEHACQASYGLRGEDRVMGKREQIKIVWVRKDGNKGIYRVCILEM